MDRRNWLTAVGGGIASGVLMSSLADAAKPVKHVYKKVKGLEIEADLYHPGGGKKHPLVWIHGGALINGTRKGIPSRLGRFAVQNDFALLSIDYRLAPETKMPLIIEDLEDAFKWMHKSHRKLQLDVSKVAVAGGSAGGYLTLTAGFRAMPRPTVLVSFWGYGDLIGDWYSKPSPHPRHHRKKLTKEAAFKQVSGPPISDSRKRKGNGGAFYQYCRQHGLWPKLVSGFDPIKEAAKFYPYMPVKNVTKDFPPTVLIHGTKDTDVPYEQSAMMAREFKKHKVPHKLLSIEGGEHGLGGGDRKKINEAYREAWKFVLERMKD